MSEIKGQIVRVVESGDVVTDIPVNRLRNIPQDDRVKVHCNGHTTFRLLPDNHDEPSGTLVAVMGSSGFLEISLVGENASQFLGLQPQMTVSVKW